MSSTSLLQEYGTPLERVERAIEALQQGKGILLMDDEDRENEGDLIFSAQYLTKEQMALMIRECSGIVCVCLTEERAKWLDLPPMVKDNRSRNQTAFTVTIEARKGVTTGVSAQDRVTTIQTAAMLGDKPSDLSRPGHVFPLVAKPNGVLTRRGHTEGTIDLMQLAGLTPSGVLCELTNPDGTMAKLPETVAFAKLHKMPVLTIEDIVEYRTGVALKQDIQQCIEREELAMGF